MTQQETNIKKMSYMINDPLRKVSNKTLETIDEVVMELKQYLSQSIQSYNVFCWKEAIILPSYILVSGWDKGETLEVIINNYKETEYYKHYHNQINK